MKLFKVSFLSFFVFLSLLVATSVFAVETPPTETQETTTPEVSKTFVISNTSIKKASILSQEGNKFDIYFEIQNGSKAQAELKSVISLVKDSSNISKTTDEYIYKSTFSLSPNTNTKNRIVYNAPAYLSGEYSLIVQVRTDSGIILGISNLGKVKLSPTVPTLDIIENSCSLSIVGEKGSPKYTLTQGVDIDPSETLSLSCTLVNSSKKEIKAIPFYETHLGTIYGEVVKTEGGDNTPITFKAGEKKVLTLSIPKSNTPQTYITELSFGSIFSDSISFKYVVKGLSASIKSLSLDKDYYSSGDVANISLLWSNSLGNNLEILTTPTTEEQKNSIKTTMTLYASIINEKGNKCISSVEQTLGYNSNGIVEIPAKVTRDCKDPQVQIQIKDSNGNILVDKQFSFTTNTKTPEFLEDNTFFAKYGLFIIIIGILIVAGFAFYFINLKKKEHAINDLSNENEKITQ